ncbi:endospore germination permease [Bacillota bacterium LX-D]|nr:endospore germination permease [Bacillota bacterium LX-D]
MLKEGKVGVYDTICLLTIMISSKVLFSSARNVVEIAGGASWLLTTVSSLTALLGFLIYYQLIKRFPGLELNEILEIVFGTILGKILSFVLCLLFFYNSTLFIREFVEAIKIYEYPMTPPSFIMLFFILALIAALYHGLEGLTRTASFFFLYILAGIAMLLALGIYLYRLSNLYPLLGYGLGEIIFHGIERSSVYGDVLLLTIVLKSLQGQEHFKKIGVISILLSGLIIAICFLCYSLAFPYFVGLENTIPLLGLARTIAYGNFFQRFESIFIFVWSISAIIATGANLYAALSIYCKTLRISDFRTLLPPLCILLFAVAFLHADLSNVAYIYVSFFRFYGGIIYFGIPLLTLLVALMRGKKKKVAQQNA